MKTWGEAVSRISCSVLAISICEAWWRRPLFDPKNGKPIERTGWISIQSQTDLSGKSPTIFFSIARNISIAIVACGGRVFLHHAGIFNTIQDENYQNLLQRIRSRPGKIPLFTVCNHRSVVDDAFLMGSIMPLWMTLQAKFHRWGICTQEICFENGLFFQVYSGAGKSLPIWRGGGVDQQLFLDFARLAAAGEWLHIFPEAGCFQFEILGGRYDRGNDRQSKGRLKWGIGKLIAHCPETPIVIPFYHSGMEHIMPQTEVNYTRKLKYKFPQAGHNVSLRVGKEVQFDDLIVDHEAKYGKLWKYYETSSCNKDTLEAEHREKWVSSHSDKILYNKITTRIEASLLELGGEMDYYGK